MCGIAGFYNINGGYSSESPHWISILNDMNRTQFHRGPDGNGTYLCDCCGLAHVRLAIIDLVNGSQPLVKSHGGLKYAISYNGEIYNMKELRSALKAEGATFDTASDTEVILEGYMRHGSDFIKCLNGIFAAAILDENHNRLILFRDRLGVKPLFYTHYENTLVFASEIKGIFAYPGIPHIIDRDGLCEVFALGPARTHGRGVFKNIFEVMPGQCITFENERCDKHFYWKLESHEHTDSLETTIEKTSWLIKDAIKMQMLSDIPISTFLSGGVDSSIVTSICAEELHKQGLQLNTFSFDFTGNDRYFKANSFQPSRDRPYVEEMADYTGTRHRFLECTSRQQADYLYKAVRARDLPCMADVESSMLYFCSEVKNYNKVTLTGECADEIFGGYPWFHNENAFSTDAFPWSYDMSARQILLDDELINSLNMEEYADNAYLQTIAETPVLQSDSAKERRRREISYLNIRWFMATLLDRMDRTSMYNGLEARVPFADHRIVEYVFNVPWNMKCAGGVTKGLLRHAAAGLLPDNVLWRKKSPYPKTYDPYYEKMLAGKLREVVSDTASPIRTLLDIAKVNRFIEAPSDYGRPWYGQLMAGPQMLAYMLQVNYWLSEYNISIEY